MKALGKKSILLKTLQVGGSTILSRLLGLTREVLQVKYLGKGIVHDAFRSAFMLPNMFRQVFAEGALSSAVTPTVVQLVKADNKDQANRIITLSFLVFEGVVLTICALFMWQSEWIVHMVTPGYSPYGIALASKLLRILMLFIFFISSNALLAGPLQAVHHFLIPALSSSLLNVFYISGLLLGIYYGVAVETFCCIILLGGLFLFVLHIVAYLKLGFAFSGINKETLSLFKPLIAKFFPAMISGSVMQLSLLVDTHYASYLPEGSVTLLGTSHGFLRLALGLIVAFSTVLLPHFSRVVTYAPKRLSFYLLETSKLIFWLTTPIAIVLMFFSERIFYTFFYSPNFGMAQIVECKLILSAFLLGLFFFSMNKVLLSMYYAMHEMWLPALVTIVVVGINTLLDAWWIYIFQTTGIALATVISNAIQTILFVALLHIRFKFRLYHLDFLQFLYRYLIQLAVALPIFYGAYELILILINKLIPSMVSTLTLTIAFWLWIMPLCLLLMFSLYFTRRFFKVHLYFLK